MRRELVPIILIVAVLTVGAVGAIDGPSHFASDGVTYQTNSGLEVELTEDREIPAVPFADDETFSAEGLELSADGEATAPVSSTAFEGDEVTIQNLDATDNPVTIARDDLSSDITVDGGASGVILHDVALDDDETDLELVVNSQATVTVTDVPDVDGIQAVDGDGDPVAGDTDTSDNTAELTFEPGTYELRLQDGPTELTVRDLVTDDIITEDDQGDPIEVEVEFFGDEGSVEQRTTTDGTIDMTGLPADERFSVSVDAGDEYVQRQIIIPSLLEQQNAFLLPQDAGIDTVEPRFLLEDPSAQFDVERSEIVLERPIDRGDGTEFVAVAGDRVGLNGFDVILERDQRYRVIVTDPASGTQRELGEFTPTQSEPITLTVEDVEFDSVAEVDGIEWTARYLDHDDGPDEIEFIFRDDFATESIDYRVVERGDEDNVLLDGSAAGNVTVSETVPADEEGTVWVVEWETTRTNGETLSAERPVSTDHLPVGPDIPDHWQTLVSLIALCAIGGLFGAVNPGLGGIAVAGTGAVFFVVGWLPDTTGGLMVALALMIAVLAYVGQKARGATT